MPAMTRAQKRRVAIEPHTFSTSLPPQHFEQPSLVLFIPEILFEIGKLLDKPELWSCSFVCSTWYLVFSPFLDWKALDNCSQYLTSMSTQHHDTKDPHDYMYRWARSGLHLDPLLERVVRPNAAFSFHASRYTQLSNDRLEYHWSKTYSQESEEVNARADVICMIVEKSSKLTRLILDLKQKMKVLPRYQCRWIESLQPRTTKVPESQSCSPSNTPSIGRGPKLDLPISMGRQRNPNPKWPLLTYVYLQRCHLEHNFFSILLGNAPALEAFSLQNVVFSEPESAHPALFPGVSQTGPILHDEQEESSTEWETNINMKASVIRSMCLEDVTGLHFTDVLGFASKLPLLQHFNYDYGKTTEKRPNALSDQRFSTVFDGFRFLYTIYLDRCPHTYVMAILKNPLNYLYAFGLSSSQVSESLVQALQRSLSSHTGFLLGVYFDNVDLINNEHAFHVLLCSVRLVRAFRLTRGVMICDPSILEQSRWVCSNLTHFAVKPKCDGGGQGYTVEEAQEAFMKQVGSLKRIQVLDFEPDEQEDDSFGFEPEKSLGLLNGMLELQDVNLGVQANKRMNTVHADQMLRMWPKLRRLYGFPENTVVGNYVEGLQSKVSVRRYRLW